MKKVNTTNELQTCLIKWRRKAIEMFEFENYDAELESDVEGLETLKVLCNIKGADLNHLERERKFACVARVFWNPKLIKFFVKRGCDVNARDENGDTALNLALRFIAASKHEQKKIVRFLLEECSADPNARNLCGENAIFTLFRLFRYDTRSWRPWWDSKEIIKIAKMLLKRGADVTARDADGKSVLHFNRKNRDIIDFLIKIHGNVNVRSGDAHFSQTPLMVAARCGNVEYCRRLVEKGADVNAVDLQGYTPLHNAVLSKPTRIDHVICIRHLLDLGANPKAQTLYGREAQDVWLLYDSSTSFDQYNQMLLQQTATINDMDSVVNLIELYKKFSFWENLLKYSDQKKHSSGTPMSTGSQETTSGRTDAEGATSRDRSSQQFTTLHFKLWNLFKFANNFHHSKMENKFKFVFEILRNYDFREFVSIEEADFSKQFRLFFDYYYNTLSRSDAYVIRDIHRVVNLFVACARERIRASGGSKIWPVFLVYESYVSACLVLMRVRKLMQFELEREIPSNSDDVIIIIPEEEKELFKENDRLLKTLFELDLRDGDGNGLIHFRRENLAWKKRSYNYLQFVRTLIKDFDYDVKSKNRLGFEPVQTIDWGNRLQISSQIQGHQSQVLLDIAGGGAHVDARNAWEGNPTMREVLEERCGKNSSFRYDTLQCACARFLVRNLVPYRQRLPKNIVEFIDSHQLY